MPKSEEGSFPAAERWLGTARDQATETDAVLARAVQLLGSMDELQIPVGRKQRLLFRLGQGRASSVRRFGWLRPVVIAAFLMGIGGGAIASVGLASWPAWIVRSYQKLVPGPKQPARPVEKPAPARRVTPKVLAVAPEVIVPVEATAPPAVVSAPRRDLVSPHPSGHARRSPVETPSDDAALLVEATRALRVDRDPGRARTLARVYLGRQPSGPLAEEALAISIEGARDHHDPDAAALSASYLARFPHGSFRALAERTLASSK